MHHYETNVKFNFFDMDGSLPLKKSYILYLWRENKYRY